jgi:hypothetical protein
VSFLYPSTISISRPNPMTGIGRQEYSGLDPSNETIVASNIPAHIQSDRQGTVPDAKLPGDAAGQGIWKIIFKGAKGISRTHDVITDDLGNRYQIISADWGPLVTTCRCQILQS